MAATERQTEAITLHDKSMVVTAGAGTGKTFVLVLKYLNLLEQEGLRPGEILALTFTDKAAAEMKDRVRSTITRRLAEDPTDRMMKEAAEEVIIAPIMTFHSFCAQILREFAIEAGLEPGFAILDGGQAAFVKKEAFEQVLRKPPAGVREALIRILSQVEKFRLAEMLFAIDEHYDHYTSFFAMAAENPEKMVEIWREFLDGIREPETERFFTDPVNSSAINHLVRLSRKYTNASDSAVKYLNQVVPILMQLHRDAPPDALARAARAFLEIRPIGRIGSKKNWDERDLTLFRDAKADITASLEKALPYFELAIDRDCAFTRATFAFYADLQVISERYHKVVTDAKKQASALDFSDLIRLCKHFLLDNQDIVQKHLRPRYKYIMVDEFQDTDPAQFDIITAITGRLIPGKRGLFIVGDPKQSIYLFRNADVTRFKEAQNRILVDCEGRLTNLDVSFRSSREVIGFVNFLFSSIFASADKPWEFGYEPLAVSPAREGCEGSVRILFPPKGESKGTLADQKEIEAGMVAEMIHQMVSCQDTWITDSSGKERPVTYGDIAILLERRTYLTQYMLALSRQDTPFYVHGGVGFYSRQEMYDIFNLLSFLLRPYDDAALLGTLRSPYIGLSDPMIHAIKTMKGLPRGTTLYGRLQRYIAENPENPDIDSLKRADRLLPGWLSSTGRIPISRLIRNILVESGILTVYGALPMGEQQVANLEKLIRIVRNRCESGSYDLSDLISDLTNSITAEEREGEAALDALAQTSVNIMTVHAAKGLEFPVVVLPDMGSSREGRSGAILAGDHAALVGVKIPNPDREYEIDETPVYRGLSLIQKEKEAAERKRLFYVGTTRARDHLILCGRNPGKRYRRIDSSNNRIDWVCTILEISPGIMDLGGELSFDPIDGSDPIVIKTFSNPDELTREWAHAQPSVITVPERYRDRYGEREIN
ncbi:MAG: UvrD-helicase domain-containing protein [Methanospirillaceae archaeon]|nr:UvrD-helicase domain-containing protein [Methanospirillaceae archaeon]